MRLHSFEVHAPYSYFLVIALILTLLSYVLRVRLFSEESSDPVLSGLLRDASIVGFGDFLFFRIHRSWQSLAKQSKRIALPYVVLSYVAPLLLTVTVLAAMMIAD
nr:hypothetical protein [uncultured bacterium]